MLCVFSMNHSYLVLVELLASGIVQFNKFVALCLELGEQFIVLVALQLIGQLDFFLMSGTDFVGHPWFVDLIAVLNASAILQNTATWAALLQRYTFAAVGLLAIGAITWTGLIVGLDCAANPFADGFATQRPPAILVVITNAKTLVLVLVLILVLVVVLATVWSVELTLIAAAVHVTVHHLNGLLHGACIETCVRMEFFVANTKLDACLWV